jgi:DNA repair exonuclease SbcCD nuclease subunit
LLAIGDIHLGRLSGRLPASLDPAALGPAAALRTAVQAARDHEVAAVLLAGDVADTSRDLFHALGTLTETLAPLQEAGIPVLAVAGNHDHDVLPRLAGRLPGLRQLGQGGRWETAQVDGPGGPVRVLGWSFPDRRHRHSPARELPRPGDGPPTVGLLHADLDAPGSIYAPVTTGELRAAGEIRWLLGHIHAPSLRPDDDAPGYLGSLVGLDPGETGPRGPWLISVDGGHVSLEHLPLAPLRWERRRVPIDDLADPARELPDHAFAALVTGAAELASTADRSLAVGVRLALTGRTVDPEALARAAAELTATRQAITASDRQVFLDAVSLDVAPALDLDDLARRDDPPGLLARTLQAVAAGGGEALLADAGRALQDVGRAGAFQHLPPEPTDPVAVRQRLLQNGYRVLAALLRTQEDRHGPA